MEKRPPDARRSRAAGGSMQQVQARAITPTLGEGAMHEMVRSE